MTARKSKTEEADDKTAGTNPAVTEQKSDEKADVPTDAAKVEKSNTEGAASGEVAGGVVPGDTGLDNDEFDTYESGVDGALGTVPERGRAGDGYEVPWKYLGAEDFEEVSNVRTSDSDDVHKAWVVQDRDAEKDGAPVALVPVQQAPGQTFTPDELPNVEVLKAAGIDPVAFLSGLPVRQHLGEDEGHRRGIPA